MNDATLRRRIAALLIATLLAVSAATLTTDVFRGDAQAVNSGGNVGNAMGG
jgi:hypothetical protein